MVSLVDRCWQKVFRIAYLGARVWWSVRRPAVRSAYVAVWWSDQLLLIRNSYKPGETVPCGGLRRGESPRAGARRELAEEVGIRVQEADLVFAWESVIEIGSVRDHVSFFELHCSSPPEIRVDRREVVDGRFWPRHSLASRPLVAQVGAYLSARHDQERLP